MWNEIIKPLQHIGEYGYQLVAIGAIFCICAIIDCIRQYLFHLLFQKQWLNNLISRLERKWFNAYLEGREIQ